MKFLKYFSIVEHQVISYVTKFENKIQLVRGGTKKRNLIRG
jgi:hypothetical protein